MVITLKLNIFTLQSMSCRLSFIFSFLVDPESWATLVHPWNHWKIRGQERYIQVRAPCPRSCAFSYHCNNIRWGTLWAINWRRGNAVPLLSPITLLEILINNLVISGVTLWRGVMVPEAHSCWDPKMYSHKGSAAWKIMKPPQSLPLQMAERLLRAQPDSVANHVTARSIGDWRALTWLATWDWQSSQ